jgi:cytoskeletal protein RodZ
MAESLGEKLKAAREARGITLSEVSAQTRIATRYLEAIEDNNYKPLPGGVFNKGFIKAYAKYVGIDETEALNDYARIVASQSSDDDDDGYKRPTVMTDDSRRSSWTSMVFAVIILALMSGGIYLLVQWYRSTPTEQAKTPPAVPTNSNSNSAANTASTPVPADKIKIELKTSSAPGQAPSVTTSIDDAKATSAPLTAEGKSYEPQNRITISFSKYQVANIAMTINGKAIALPSQPLKPADQVIKFDVTKENVAQIISDGHITLGDVAPVPVPGPAGPPDPNSNAAVNTATPGTAATTPRATPKVTPAKTPAQAANSNTGSTPAATPAKTPVKTPVVKPTVITVPPAATPKKPGE